MVAAGTYQAAAAENAGTILRSQQHPLPVVDASSPFVCWAALAASIAMA
jgi:hypothetical protein